MFLFQKLLTRLYLKIVATCGILGEKYFCGVLCVTESFLYFIDAVSKASFSFPLESIEKLRISKNDLFVDGISFSAQKEKVSSFLYQPESCFYLFYFISIKL